LVQTVFDSITQEMIFTLTGIRYYLSIIWDPKDYSTIIL
jgi:hypothetical protein